MSLDTYIYKILGQIQIMTFMNGINKDTCLRSACLILINDPVK